MSDFWKLVFVKKEHFSNVDVEVFMHLLLNHAKNKEYGNEKKKKTTDKQIR